ncbi:MAG: hypothetical protein NZ518_10160, partial [Dehalococcoidia bacterium]|nr:hypothetical protein [Dehalococcoidia bacterium]
LPRGEYRVSLDEQASFAIQAVAHALAAGVQRVGFYKMRDDAGYGPGAEPYGLVRADGQPKPIYTAIQTLTKHLENAGAATRSFEGSIVKVTFTKPGTRTTVLWTMGPAPAVATLPAFANTATIVDKYGRARTTGPTGGAYLLELAPATANTVPGDPSAFLVGGSPLIVIESK